MVNILDQYIIDNQSLERSLQFLKAYMKGGIDHENTTFKRPSLSPKQ